MTNRPNLSLCMIVRNEARTLARCLASAKPWVDELVVVDTGSTDETVAIAQAAGANAQHTRATKLLLPLKAELGQHDVPRIAADGVTIEFHNRRCRRTYGQRSRNQAAQRT